MIDDFDEIANEEFERTTSTLDRLARLWGLDDYHAAEPLPQDHQYELFDYDYKPIRCRLCGGNHWTIESHDIYVCEHGTVYGLLRQLDSVRAARVLSSKLIDSLT